MFGLILITLVGNNLKYYLLPIPLKIFFNFKSFVISEKQFKKNID